MNSKKVNRTSRNKALEGIIDEDYKRNSLKTITLGALTLFFMALIGLGARYEAKLNANNKDDQLKERTYISTRINPQYNLSIIDSSTHANQKIQGKEIIQPAQSEQNDLEKLIKGETYGINSNIDRKFDRKVKLQAYSGIKKGEILREEAIKYLKSELNTNLETNIVLPRYIANNPEYRRASIAMVKQQFNEYNPKELGDDAEYFVNTCLDKRVNPIFALGVFFNESNYGTRGIARITKNPGNIRGSGDKGSYYGFARYSSWQRGIDAFVDLIYNYPKTFLNNKSINVSNVIKIWAPPSENDTEGYIKRVLDFMRENTKRVNHTLETYKVTNEN